MQLHPPREKRVLYSRSCQASGSEQEALPPTSHNSLSLAMWLDYLLHTASHQQSSSCPISPSDGTSSTPNTKATLPARTDPLLQLNAPSNPSSTSPGLAPEGKNAQAPKADAIPVLQALLPDA